jgi:glycine betaine/proline transport system substrate-binding protein
VPEYSDITSIDELPEHADELDGKIIGIEPGAGLTKMTKESVIPGYGLDKDFDLVLSSTVAMLTELKKATEDEEPIVVTLWKPFWANLAYPVRALEDMVVNDFGDGEEAKAVAAWLEKNPEFGKKLESHLKQ